MKIAKVICTKLGTPLYKLETLQQKIRHILREYKLLTDSKYEFQAHRSTSQASLDSIEEIIHTIDAKNMQ